MLKQMLLAVATATLLAFGNGGAIAGDVTAADVTAAVRPDLSHPYLYFTADDKKEILARIESDPGAAAIMERLVTQADRRLAQPVEKQAPPRSGSPWDPEGGKPYQDYYNGNLADANMLAFVYQMTGDPRYARKSWELAETVCDLPVWNYRAHDFAYIYDRVWPWNVPDDRVAFGYDIMSARAGRYLGAVYDWIYEALEPRERDRLRGALLEKVVAPVRGDLDLHWWATAYRCNWSGVCFSGTGIASLALLAEEPGLAGLVADSHNGTWRMFSELDGGGGWQEGVSYFQYGFRHATQFADVLKRVTAGRINLFEHPELKEHAIDAIIFNSAPPDRSMSFGDSPSRIVGTSYFLNKVAAETGNTRAAWYRDRVAGRGRDLFDLLWPRTEVAAAAPEQPSHLFPDLHWASLRSSFTDPSAFTIGVKAGFNDDPHHGHLDCGQIILYWQGVGYLAEMPSAQYDKEYFLEERWTYPKASSGGHNVLRVNGEEQISAKLKNQPWREGLGGPITAFSTTPARDFVSLDAGNAYPGEHVKGWRRLVVLEKPDLALIVDEVESAPGAEIALRFHSEADFGINGRVMLLEHTSGTLALIPGLPPEAGTPAWAVDHHSIKPGPAGGEPGREPFAEFKLAAPGARTVVPMIVASVSGADEAERVRQSIVRDEGPENALSISLEHRGRRHAFRFAERAGRLTLLD